MRKVPIARQRECWSGPVYAKCNRQTYRNVHVSPAVRYMYSSVYYKRHPIRCVNVRSSQELRYERSRFVQQALKEKNRAHCSGGGA